MAEPILQLHRLGKRYTLGATTAGQRGLRHVIQDVVTGPFRRWRALQSDPFAARPETSSRAGQSESGQGTRTNLWALKDVSFAVQPGEVVGIIGRNGAGKSTLLKIISRITAPTTGRIILDGRVASLLEVGTGFHPELTGRENIFLNGAILGMSRAEIRVKFDQIVAFAEVERFLDTPVKRYSSGMYMRLAFAVAAHLEPEILIVDEVLAVGDSAFQQKCLGKMEEVATQHGRTVLFVSHNLAAVQRLCSSCKLLEGGELVAEGSPGAVVRQYLDSCGQSHTVDIAGSASAECEIRLRCSNHTGQEPPLWAYGQALQIDVTIATKRPLHRPAVDLSFYDGRRVRLFALQSDRLSSSPDRIEGCWTAGFTVQNPGLTIPELTVDVGVREGSGQYIVLAVDAVRLATDPGSLPEAAAADTLLHPASSHTWKSIPEPPWASAA